MSDQLSELAAQLPDNLAQLAQIEALLKEDPSNAELSGIREDLKQVIQLTRELQKEAGVDVTDINEDANDANTISTSPHALDAAAASSSSLPSSVPAVGAAALSSPMDYSLPFSAAAGSPGPFRPGSRVFALYAKDSKYYVARVDRVDPDNLEYGITWLEYNEPATVAFSDVKPFRHAPQEILARGNVPVKAIYPGDGLFHSSTVESSSPDNPGYWIVRFSHFTDAGNKKKKKVEVAQQDIILNEKYIDAETGKLISAAPAAAAAASAASTAKSASAPLLSEEPDIPENLQIQPDDPEAVKQSKLKRIKKLRFEHRKLYADQVASQKKNSWQDFKAGKLGVGQGPAKKQKLTTVAGLQQVNRQSIFATPDNLEGVVGVVGSGRGVTGYQAGKKMVFDQTAGAAATEQ